MAVCGGWGEADGLGRLGRIRRDLGQHFGSSTRGVVLCDYYVITL